MHKNIRLFGGCFYAAERIMNIISSAGNCIWTLRNQKTFAGILA
jgi:hypothetical protein